MRKNKKFQRACRAAAKEGIGFGASGEKVRLDQAKGTDRGLMAGYHLITKAKRGKR